MATIDQTGVTPVDLQGYKDILEARFREEFGETLSVDPETPAGQIISVAALMLAEADENVVSIGNAMSLDHSSGSQVDDLGSLLHIRRIPETFTTVTATLSGVVGTQIPAGSRAKKESTGEEFELISSVTIGSSGSVNGNFRSVSAGPIEVSAGQLNRIVTLISGWEAVSNSASHNNIGENSETDVNMKNRYRLITGQNGCATRDSLIAAIINSGADRVKIEENDSAAAVTRQGLTIAGRGLMVIVLGGDRNEIARSVLEHKPLGVAMSGNTTHASGATHGIYQSVTVTPLRVNLVVNTLPGSIFPADGVNDLRNALVQYAGGSFTGGTGQFETDGFQIGENIDLARLRVPLYSVPGHEVTTFEVKIKGNAGVDTDTALPSVTPLATLYTLAAGDINISVTTS